VIFGTVDARGARLKPEARGHGRFGRRLVSGVLGALLGCLPPAAAAQQVIRYSGKVERVDVQESIVIVTELAARGKSRRHEVHVPPETLIVSASRLRPWEMRGGHAFEEVSVSLVDLLAGDFVVVDSVIDGARAVALRITIVEDRSRTRPFR
jgi:hypothetical protein